MRRKSLWNNAAVLAVSGAMVRVGGMLWTLYLGRSLGPELFGTYAVIIGLASIITPLSDFGVG